MVWPKPWGQILFPRAMQAILVISKQRLPMACILSPFHCGELFEPLTLASSRKQHADLTSEFIFGDETIHSQFPPNPVSRNCFFPEFCISQVKIPRVKEVPCSLAVLSQGTCVYLPTANGPMIWNKPSKKRLQSVCEMKVSNKSIQWIDYNVVVFEVYQHIDIVYMYWYKYNYIYTHMLYLCYTHIYNT